MLHHVVDRLQHRDLVVLRPDDAKQLVLRHRLDHLAGAPHCLVQTLGQLLLRPPAARSELFISLADVRLASDAVEDPLADVAGEMETEVANGVGSLGGALPDLLIVEKGEAGVDAGEILAELGDGEFEENLFRGYHGTLAPW